MNASTAGIDGQDDYDVAVLGAGMAGGLLGAILARNGVKVLLIDAGSHPRFAVGESTIPYTSAMSRIIAERYGVPEIRALAGFQTIRDRVARTCGIKDNFGFVYHREGESQDPRQVNQLVIPDAQSSETHLFRQDVDAYLFNVAVRYGAEPLLGTRIKDVDIQPDSGVMLRSEAGREYRAKYVVDGGGFRSPLADKFGLRDEPTVARHHSRSMFTHMIGVTPFDDAPAAARHDNPSPWHRGTLHHVFDGGWLWVIPFDNHEQSLNPLCSVGLTLDERAHPRPETSAQEEFDRFLDRFPQIKAQFETARTVRPWVATGRLQYSSKETVGERFCLTSHAAGFIDALYSRGLTNTFEVVNALGWRLIAASRDGDWSTERFAYIDSLQKGLFGVHDDIVYSSFVGFRDYDLWNAALRTWKVTSLLPTMTIERAYRTFLRTRDDGVFRALEETDTPGLPALVGADVTGLLVHTRRTCQEVEAGSLGSAKAAERLFDRLERSDFLPPSFELGNPDNRCFEATPQRIDGAIAWARGDAPENMRTLLGDAARTTVV
jgi:FADH2 O2-dependent halogenase